MGEERNDMVETALEPAPTFRLEEARHAILPLVLRGVCFEADGQRLIDGLSFQLRAGPRTMVLGPNGSGKSLTLRLCHGLLDPSAGTLGWHGSEGEGVPGDQGGNGGAAQVRARQAMVFQRPVLLRRSVLDNVTYALSLRRNAKVSREMIRIRAQQALERTGLAELAHRQARVLSGGEQQRLALARAWATEPEVLFLDEPTANLDPAASRAVEGIIAAIHAGGTKIVMTTHDLGQARRMADEVLFLHRGRLLEAAPADSFFNAPHSPEARAFLAGELLW